MIVTRQRLIAFSLLSLFLLLSLSACSAGVSQKAKNAGNHSVSILPLVVETVGFQSGSAKQPPQPQDPYGNITGNTTISTALNAAAIVFREGLEAILILASLMGSLKRGEMRRLRSPLWVGAALSLVATVLTWILAQEILSALAGFGERLEAIVSLIAIGVLLLITNWFFHKIYWTGWIANFHSQKGRLLGVEFGQWIGLVILGFSSIYREGFEVVLFSQALVLQAGSVAVFIGVGLGVLATVVVGVIVFGLQMKLPYKKMLVVTGILIGWVLIILVGNTVNVLQTVGWLPVHNIGDLQSPTWLILAAGLFPNWEGILLQIAAGTFVIGSYFLAEHQQQRKKRAEYSQ